MSRVEQALLRAFETEDLPAEAGSRARTGRADQSRSIRADLRLVSHGSGSASRHAQRNPYVRRSPGDAPALRAPEVEFERAVPFMGGRSAAPADVVPDSSRASGLATAWDNVLEQASALARAQAPVAVPAPKTDTVIDQAGALGRTTTAVPQFRGSEVPGFEVPGSTVRAEEPRNQEPRNLGTQEPRNAFVWVPIQSPTTAGGGILANAIASEQFRKLAGQMIRAQETHGVKVVMITSALQGEGKSSTSASLALTLANSYKRDVLLVDADMRLPSLHTMFQLPPGWGMCELLENTQSNQVSPYQVTPMLGVLTAGRPQRDPVGALTSARMHGFIEAASAKYDFVIVDTPPVGVLPDANLLGSMVDAVLLVISAGTTQYDFVNRAVEAITKERILGVVLNRAEQGLTLKAYEYSKY